MRTTKQKKAIIYRPINTAVKAFIIYPTVSPYLLLLLIIGSPEFWLAAIIIPIVLSLYIFVIMRFATEISLAFRKITLDYFNHTISSSKQYALKFIKNQNEVTIDLYDVYMIKLSAEKIRKNMPDRPKNYIRVAYFYLFDESKKTIVLDYLGRKKLDDLIRKIHTINPNIYIIGLGYKFSVVQK